MIEVSDLSFEYEGKVVLKNVTFSVQPNSVVALVGPNGAGKTTLMRCLAALEVPVAGQVRINSINALEFPRRVHRCMGYLSDFFGLYDRLTVEQCLRHVAACQKIKASDISARIEAVSRDTDLAGYMDKAAGTLSRGYRQRLGVAMSILHQPKVLLLDEPASGMDPEARVGLSDLILRLKGQGMTIVVSSHILAELEDYCTDMLVLREGVIRDHVTYDAQQKTETRSIVVKCLNVEEEYLTYIKSEDGVCAVKSTDNSIDITYAGDDAGLSHILNAMVGHKIPVIGFEVKKKSLQNAYMDLAVEGRDKS